MPIIFIIFIYFVYQNLCRKETQIKCFCNLDIAFVLYLSIQKVFWGLCYFAIFYYFLLCLYYRDLLIYKLTDNIIVVNLSFPNLL